MAILPYFAKLKTTPRMHVEAYGGDANVYVEMNVMF